MDERTVRMAEEILEGIRKGEITRKNLNTVKSRIAAKYNIQLPSNEDMFGLVSEDDEDRELFVRVLQRRPNRTASGISIIAVMTKPDKCPHGRCVYCPTEPDIPQSYLDEEPAVMRGKAFDFDPKKQVEWRVHQLEMIGHPADKCELILMGGTFTSKPYQYQYDFVKGCFDGLNGTIGKDLKDSQKRNEKAVHRCVGLNVETRPDYAKEKQINEILDFGATKIEIGVQTLDDRIHELTKRGHTVKDVIEATRIIKDSGLKLCYHMMPNLPGATPESDLKTFRRLFSDEDFRPDMLKIYPTLVVKGSELYDWWKEGKYEPYPDDVLIELLSKVKAELPEYVRIMRLQRDVPRQYIEAGCKFSNLRQIVRNDMKKHGLKCNCIRCREIGYNLSGITKDSIEKAELKEIVYKSSGGTEHFLQWVTPENLLIGLLRLRFPGRDQNEFATKDSAIVRELHVFGPAVSIGETSDILGSVQHRGFGKKLLLRAEEIAASENKERIIVTSGVGARDYYRKFGYELMGNYMGKRI
ncbi:MAG: tRNA uridine(34) 5-carboxymethylaminomethyl modification radical SAM/GNAT enzyme Elp3 [Candidatus Micrarchaeota archaeon]|nr:tRNA uridine(34) 5-carboxymethylaminomethyl modification radical SAM/GNAT enzyme Elp3 [Candidatus Micrarchaeota archaeon]